MTLTRRRGPAQGPHATNNTTVHTVHAPRWTDADVALAWQLGFEYASGPAWALRAAEAIDDAVHATILPPQVSYEERVLARIAAMESDAERARQQLAETAARNREHDRQVLASAGVR